MPESVKPSLKSRIFQNTNFNPAIIIVSSVVLIAVLSWSAKAWRTSSINSTSPPVNPSQPSAPLQGKREKATPAPSDITVEPVTLKPGGFEPKELRLQASPFVLSVNNRSRVFDLSFELYREDGHKLHEIKGPKGQVHPMKLIDLPPGNYLLKEVNHPEWTCRIVLSR